MHPFPPLAELRCFAEDSIAQISLDPHGVQFAFESGRRLAAEERIEHVEPDGAAWRYDCEAAHGPPLVLHRLLHRRIVTIERDDLRLTFKLEDGASLTVFSELGPYESGQIEIPGRPLIVF